MSRPPHYATYDQLRRLSVQIAKHEGLDTLRDTTHGTVRIETAYAMKILDALCAVIDGEMSYAGAELFIREMAP